MKNIQEKANIIEYVGFAHACLTGELSNSPILQIEETIHSLIERKGIAQTEKTINEILNSNNASPLIRTLCKTFIYRYDNKS